MKESTFIIILIFVILLIVGGSVYVGYGLKHCPEQSIPVPNYKPVIVHDTFFREQIKAHKHEKNPYTVVVIDSVAVFDSIAKYYGR